MEGRTEQGEGMVNVENLRRLAGTLEKMGEAKRRIMIIPREETGAGISEGEVEKLLEGEDERLIAKMKQAREEVDCHRRIVDGVWEQLGTKPFRHFFQELTGEKPVGQMGVGRTDLTIHLIMKKEEDMEVLGAADAREGKKVKLVWGGKVIGCVFDYLGRERNGWSVGGYTAELRGSQKKWRVAEHERKHVENALWKEAGLFQLDETDWQRLTDFMTTREKGKEIVGEMPVFLFGGPDYKVTNDLYQAAAEVKMGRFDGEVADELLARLTVDPELTIEKLMEGMGGDSYLCFQFGKAVLRWGAYGGMLPVVSNYLRKPDGAYDKLIKASQTLLEAQKEKLKRGLEVYQRLVKLYGGDRVKVEAMLSFVPIRRWGAVERILKSYGSLAGAKS